MFESTGLLTCMLSELTFDIVFKPCSGYIPETGFLHDLVHIIGIYPVRELGGASFMCGKSVSTVHICV